MRALLAASPIALLLALLLATRRSAGMAAWSALALALLLAWAPLGFAPAAAEPGAHLLGVALEGLFIAATILWILLPALAIHELQIRTGALLTLRAALERTAPDAASRTLLVGWFFALFLEGAAGFGTPLAVAAPMLVAIGVAPVPAVAATLIGHVAGVSFGAIGTPVIAQAGISSASAADIARYSALLLLPLAWIPAAWVVRAAPGGAGHGAAARRYAFWAMLLFCLPYVGAALWTGPELPTLAGALLGGAAFVWYVRRRRPAPRTPAGAARALLFAATPYLLLIALILCTRLIPPLKAATGAFTFSWTFEGVYSGSLLPLYHPGTLLALAFLATGLARRTAPRDLGASIRAAAVRLSRAVVALVAMLILSRLMLHTGMIAELAQAAARAVGALWPALAPWVGALGSFVTGSATASNILFTNLQEQAVAPFGLPLALVLAAQTLGAAVGNAICPHNIIAGAAAVGAAGREGEILRRTLPVCAAILVLAGALSLLAVR